MLRIPNDWSPRDYQLPAWQALEGGCKRVLPIWHRRSGKDDIALHWTAVSILQRPGTYWHMLPKYEQARKAIWDERVDVVRDGKVVGNRRRIDWAFPHELRERTRDDLMQIKFRNGAVWQVVGSDNPDSLVGTNPVGIVFSEYALANPASWAFLEPILEQNGGWAIFPTTPRGENHCFTMYQERLEDPEWFVQRLPASETGVFTTHQLDRIARGLRGQYGKAIGDAMYRQEYEVSFQAPVLGAYYAEWLDRLEQDKAICRLPYDPDGGPVMVSFDLGVGDQTAIWFAQQVGREVHILDYHAAMGQGMDYYVGQIRERFKDHQIGTVILPHDAKHREKLSGRSVQDYLNRQGFQTVVVGAPRNQEALMGEINAVRRFLPRCVFDREKCQQGLAALRNYRSEYDENNKVLGKPVHDWASHGADSFRTLVMGWDKVVAASRGSAAPVMRRKGVPV